MEDFAHRLCEAIGFYDYYRAVAAARFAVAGASGDFPSTWSQWKALPLSRRRELSTVAGKLATDAFKKAIKEFEAPFNPNSTKQKQLLLYHFFGIATNEISRDSFPDFDPPWGATKGIREIRTRSQNGEYTPSTDRESIEKILAKAPDDRSMAAFWAAPFINIFLAHADFAKSLQFLKCKTEKGKFHSSLATAAETGRLTAKKLNVKDIGWNCQNIDPELRIIFITPSGWKFIALDYSQIDSRMVAVRCFLTFGALRYLAATECGDLHSLACSMVWDDLPWPEDFTIEQTIKHGPFPKDMLKAAKKLANTEGYRGKTKRALSKTLGHGTNYWGQPQNMSRQAHIDLKLVQRYQDVYFSVFPEIKQWHNWIIEQLQLNNGFYTIFGRHRYFLGRPDDAATIREAIAHDGQSPAADYTNHALLRLHKAVLAGEIPMEIFLQKHDEIGVRAREEDIPEVLAKMQETMETHYTLTAPNGTTRDWYVPAEAAVGWNLGHRKDYDDKGNLLEKPINPDGLLELKGLDTRTRCENPLLPIKPSFLRSL